MCDLCLLGIQVHLLHIGACTQAMIDCPHTQTQSILQMLHMSLQPPQHHLSAPHPLHLNPSSQPNPLSTYSPSVIVRTSLPNQAEYNRDLQRLLVQEYIKEVRQDKVHQ